MTVKECYVRMGADYEDVLRRLKTEDRVRKFLAMLLRDSSFQDLCAAMESGDGEAAFRSAHTLKGILLNLSLTRLAQQASELTEALRACEAHDKVLPLFDAVKQGYEELRRAVGELLESPGEGGDAGEGAQ